VCWGGRRGRSEKWLKRQHCRTAKGTTWCALDASNEGKRPCVWCSIARACTNLPWCDTKVTPSPTHVHAHVHAHRCCRSYTMHLRQTFSQPASMPSTIQRSRSCACLTTIISLCYLAHTLRVQAMLSYCVICAVKNRCLGWKMQGSFSFVSMCLPRSVRCRVG